MPNFIAKNFLADFLSNFKVFEFKHELEPGDLGDRVLDEALVTTLGDLDGLKTNLKTLSNDDKMTCDDVMN